MKTGCDPAWGYTPHADIVARVPTWQTLSESLQVIYPLKISCKKCMLRHKGVRQR